MGGPAEGEEVGFCAWGRRLVEGWVEGSGGGGGVLGVCGCGGRGGKGCAGLLGGLLLL